MLAQQLYVVLDTRLPARIDEISDRPEGRLTNPLRPDEEVLATIPTTNGPLNIMLELVRRQDGPPIWLFSPSTLAAIPGAFSEVDLFSLDQHLPAFLVKPRMAGIRLFNWLALFLVVPLAYRLMALLHAIWSPRTPERVEPPRAARCRVRTPHRRGALPHPRDRHPMADREERSAPARASVLVGGLGAVRDRFGDVAAAARERGARAVHFGSGLMHPGARRWRRWCASRGGSRTAW